MAALVLVTSGRAQTVGLDSYRPAKSHDGATLSNFHAFEKVLRIEALPAAKYEQSVVRQLNETRYLDIGRAYNSSLIVKSSSTRSTNTHWIEVPTSQADMCT